MLGDLDSKQSEGLHGMCSKKVEKIFGGRGGIRTPDRFAPIQTFQVCALGHYATLPQRHSQCAHCTKRLH